MHNLRFRDLAGFERKQHNGLRITSFILSSIAIVAGVAFMILLSIWLFKGFVQTNPAEIFNDPLLIAIGSLGLISAGFLLTNWIIGLIRVSTKVSQTRNHNEKVEFNNLKQTIKLVKSEDGLEDKIRNLLN